jgi:hypothetical protein
MSLFLRKTIGVTAVWVSAALLAVPGIPASAAPASGHGAAIANPVPGPQWPELVLVPFAQHARFAPGGFATVSDGQGDTFVSWTNFGKKAASSCAPYGPGRPVA